MDIVAAKQRLVAHQAALDDARAQITRIELLLAKIDPQRVLATEVPGYTDPPERVARAAADKAAGFVTVLTPEHVAAIKAGTRPHPIFTGPAYSHIARFKTEVVSLNHRIAMIEEHGRVTKAALSRLDPQTVAAVRVLGYRDPPTQSPQEMA